jgi:hypothetical protein
MNASSDRTVSVELKRTELCAVISVLEAVVKTAAANPQAVAELGLTPEIVAVADLAGATLILQA